MKSHPAERREVVKNVASARRRIVCITVAVLFLLALLPPWVVEAQRPPGVDTVSGFQFDIAYLPVWRVVRWPVESIFWPLLALEGAIVLGIGLVALVRSARKGCQSETR